MQPSRRSHSRIGVPLRPEPQLAYDRLSDPILACRDVALRRGSRRHDPLEGDARAAAGPTRDGLATLPAAQPHALVLKDALGLSLEEISAPSGMPAGTAKCYAQRARTTMRELLEEGAAA